MRLAKFLVSHSELEWIYQAQDVSEKYVVFGVCFAFCQNQKILKLKTLKRSLLLPLSLHLLLFPKVFCLKMFYIDVFEFGVFQFSALRKTQN